MAKLPGIPRTGRWVKKDGAIDPDTDKWLQKLVAAVDASTQQFSSASDTSASASVSTTEFPTSDTLSGGLYQVTYAMWLTQAATVNSSLTFTATWENNGQTFTQSGAALTSNTLTSQQNGTFMFNIDPSTTVSYAFTYATAGATAMTYSYDVRLSVLPSGGQ